MQLQNQGAEKCEFGFWKEATGSVAHLEIMTDFSKGKIHNSSGMELGNRVAAHRLEDALSPRNGFAGQSPYKCGKF